MALLDVVTGVELVAIGDEDSGAAGIELINGSGSELKAAGRDMSAVSVMTLLQARHVPICHIRRQSPR